MSEGIKNIAIAEKREKTQKPSLSSKENVNKANSVIIMRLARKELIFVIILVTMVSWKNPKLRIKSGPPPTTEEFLSKDFCLQPGLPLLRENQILL